MNVLDLFTGIGGNAIAYQTFLGWRAAAYVEIDPFCQRVLRDRFDTGYLQSAPIWDDIKTFDGRPWRGVVDFITASDPCQINSAARQTGERPESLAEDFLRVVGEVQPAFVMRENPARVRSDAPGSADRIADALETQGYRVSLVEAKACCVGADHRRNRLFVLAQMVYPDSDRQEREIRSQCESAATRWLRETIRPNRWSAAPRVCRGADGIPQRLDRVRAIGNATVPPVVAAILSVFGSGVQY